MSEEDAHQIKTHIDQPWGHAVAGCTGCEWFTALFYGDIMTLRPFDNMPPAEYMQAQLEARWKEQHTGDPT